MEKVSFFGRLEFVLELLRNEGIPLFLVGIAGVLVLVGLFFLVFHYKVDWIVFLLLFAASISGIRWAIVDVGSTFVRWMAILLLVFCALLKRGSPGPVVKFFWVYVLLGLLFLFRSPVLGYSIQKTGLLIAVAVAIPVALGGYCRDIVSVEKLLNAAAIVGAIWGVGNFPGVFSQLDLAARYSGLSESAPQFAIIGGILLPFTLWAAICHASSRMRFLFSIAFLMSLFVILSTIQRTGTIGGILALLPLLLRFKRKALRIGLVIAVVVVVAISIVSLMSEYRLEYMTQRYNLMESDQDLAMMGRIQRWQIIWQGIKVSPLFGNGIGSSNAHPIVVKSFHSAYLTVWYETGIFGLLSFVSAIAYSVVLNFRAFLQFGEGPERDALRTTLGVILGYAAMGFTESAGSGASHIAVMLFLFSVTLLHKISVLGVPARRTEVAPVRSTSVLQHE